MNLRGIFNDLPPSGLLPEFYELETTNDFLKNLVLILLERLSVSVEKILTELCEIEEEGLRISSLEDEDVCRDAVGEEGHRDRHQPEAYRDGGQEDSAEIQHSQCRSDLLRRVKNS